MSVKYNVLHIVFPTSKCDVGRDEGFGEAAVVCHIHDGGGVSEGKWLRTWYTPQSFLVFQILGAENPTGGPGFCYHSARHWSLFLAEVHSGEVS